MAAKEQCVLLDGVTRTFGRVTALAQLSFEVRHGGVTVLLGPNGAGKTTALRMITGSLSPQSGSVRVFELDPVTDGETIRQRAGVVPATPEFYERLSGWENLRFAADIYSLGSHAPIEPSAERFGIAGALDDAVGSYSTGMKARLALARAILHDPDLLLMDEPTSGLDPESAHAVLALIDEMAEEGKTVVMSTHLLLEAEGLADQVVVMDAGRVLVSGAPSELIGRYWPTATVLLDAEDRTSLGRVENFDGVLSIEGNGGPVNVSLDDIKRIPDLVAELSAQGIRLTRVVPHEPSLEELYFTVRKNERKGRT
ncbi:MAG: ATP-binding cassette domain-containing protein [Actinomycetota bacterium]